MNTKFTNPNISLKIKEIDTMIDKKPGIEIELSSVTEAFFNTYNISTKDLINLILKESKNNFYELAGKIYKNTKLFKELIEPLQGATIGHEVKNKFIITLKPRIDIEIANEIFPLYKSSHEYSSYDFLEISNNITQTISDKKLNYSALSLIDGFNTFLSSCLSSKIDQKDSILEILKFNTVRIVMMNMIDTALSDVSKGSKDYNILIDLKDGLSKMSSVPFIKNDK